MKSFAFVMFLVLLPFMVFAQAVDPTAPLGNMDAIQQIMAELKGAHLAGLGGVVVVIQVIMLGLRSEYIVNLFGQAKAGCRLATVLLLSWVGGVLYLMQSGMSFKAAILNSTSMAAFQVFAHQVYTIYIEKKVKA